MILEHHMDMFLNARSIVRQRLSNRTTQELSHSEEMRAMRRATRELNRNQDSALQFLQRAGLVTKTGRAKRLLRD